MNQLIIRLKIILKSKIFIYLFLGIVFIYCFIYIKFNLYKPNYDINDKVVHGIIKNVNIDGNLVKIYIDDILINYYCDNEDELYKYQIGDEITVSGDLRVPDEENNFNLFNYRNYLLSKKIYYVMSAESIEIDNNDIDYRYKFKRFIIRVIENRTTTDYLKTFILGDSSLIEDEIMKSYQIVGVSHLFSVSGMHVTLLANLLIKILDGLNFKKKYKYFCIFSFLILYTFLTNFSPSIIRATALFICIRINKELKFDIPTDYLLIYILLIALLCNPFYIYNTGFIFSYLISFFLIKYQTIINKHKNYFVKLFLTSLLAFLVSIPIMINNFFSINLLTPIFNLIFVPLVSLIIFPLSLLTFICPFLDDLFSIFLSLLEYLASIMSKINIGNITLCHIPMLVLIIYYIIIIFIINKFKKNEYKYIVILFLMLFIHHNINYLNPYPTITFINVGQGDSILFTLPHNQGNFLIDCAESQIFYDEDWKKKNKNYSVGDNVIVPFLKSQGINKLNYVINTHGDYDHLGAMQTIISSIKVEKVIFNSGNNNELESDYIDTLKKNEIQLYQLSKGKIKINDYEIKFLNDKNLDDENEDSLVIYIDINDIKILLMGDTGFETEEYLLNEYNLENMDILKVGHHGSKYSTSEKFIQTINPKYSVISVGENNKFGHPDESVLKNLANSTTYLTSINGSIKFILSQPILVKAVR